MTLYYAGLRSSRRVIAISIEQLRHFPERRSGSQPLKEWVL